MEIVIYFFTGALGIAAILASIAIWAPRNTPIRAIAVVVTALFVPVAYLQVTELLSKPKPTHFEWWDRNAEEAMVLGASFHEGKAIYLWLRLDGAMQPRYYMLPWRPKLAEKLEDLIDEAIRKRGSVVIKNLFSRQSPDELGDYNVEFIPPAVPPIKLPRLPPQVFNPREAI